MVESHVTVKVVHWALGLHFLIINYESETRCLRRLAEFGINRRMRIQRPTLVIFGILLF